MVLRLRRGGGERRPVRYQLAQPGADRRRAARRRRPRDRCASRAAGARRDARAAMGLGLARSAAAPPRRRRRRRRGCVSSWRSTWWPRCSSTRRLTDGGAAFVTELATRTGLRPRRARRARAAGRVQHPRGVALRPVRQARQPAASPSSGDGGGGRPEAAVDLPAGAGRRPPGRARAHELLLREAGAGAVATFPLGSGGEVVGALTPRARRPDSSFDAPTLELARPSPRCAGPIVDVEARRGERSLGAHALALATSFWEKLVGAASCRARSWLPPATVRLAAVLRLGRRHLPRFRRRRVEGEVQRAITAPIAGFVKEAPRRAGDTVKQGDVHRRASTTATCGSSACKLVEPARASTPEQYREAMAKHDRAAGARSSPRSSSRPRRSSRWSTSSCARTEMVAPFDGVIVSGDLSQLLGAPVERGQVLFEVAPLDGFRVVLQVDERDIAHVRVGPARRAGALRRCRTSASLHRHHDHAGEQRARTARNCFRVEARLDARARAPAPGHGRRRQDRGRRAHAWPGSGRTAWSTGCAWLAVARCLP